MKSLVITILAALLASSTSVLAIDRDADMIDSASIDVSLFDAVDVVAITLWSEIALKTIHEEWAILAGVKYGVAEPDDGNDDDSTWYVGAGVKFYATDFTSFAVIGSYQDYGSAFDADAISGTFYARHRLLSAEEILSPYFAGSFSLQNFTYEAPFSSDSEEFVNMVMTATIGCDFMMQPNLAIRFEGGFSQSQALEGDENKVADGWLASAAMVYYWDE